MAAIWKGSLSLTLIALTFTLLLVLVRIRRERGNRLAAVRQKKIRLLLNRALASSYDFVAGDLRHVATLDPYSLITVAADLLRNLRGTDEQRLSAMLRECGLLPILQKAAYNGRRALRIQAISVLSHFGHEHATDTLMDQVLDPDPDIGLAALRGLSVVQVLPSLDGVLRPLFLRGKNLPLMMDIMRRFSDAVEPDLSILASEDLPLDIRVAALRALAATGSPFATETGLRLCNDPEPIVRAEAVAALATTARTEAQETLLSALNDADADVRLEAAKACGSLGLVKAAPRLTDIVRHDEWRTRFHAAQALWSLGEGGIAILRDLADRGDVLAHDILAEKGAPA